MVDIPLSQFNQAGLSLSSGAPSASSRKRMGDPGATRIPRTRPTKSPTNKWAHIIGWMSCQFRLRFYRKCVCPAE